MVEQRPFKPKVVGSIPTAPTNHLLESRACKQLGSKISTRLQLSLLSACFNAFRMGFNSMPLSIANNVAIDSKRYARV